MLSGIRCKQIIHFKKAWKISFATEVFAVMSGFHRTDSNQREKETHVSGIGYKGNNLG